MTSFIKLAIYNPIIIERILLYFENGSCNIEYVAKAIGALNWFIFHKPGKEIFDHFFYLKKSRPYGQPGQMPNGNFRCLID